MDGEVSLFLVCLRVRPTSSEQVILKALCAQCTGMTLELGFMMALNAREGNDALMLPILQ